MRDCGRVYHNFSPRLTVLYLFWGGALSRVDTGHARAPPLSLHDRRLCGCAASGSAHEAASDAQTNKHNR